MDLTNLTLAGLVALGIVNVVTFFIPNLDTKIKFLVAFLAAFIVTFVPADLGSIILDKAKFALEIAFASSGAYKLSQVIGAKSE